MLDKKIWIKLKKFTETVSYIRGILQINNVFYVVDEKGISTLNNEVYKFQSNKEYYWCATCRVGNNILVVRNENYGDDDVESRLFNPINYHWSDVDIRTKRKYFAVVYYLNKVYIVGGWDEGSMIGKPPQRSIHCRIDGKTVNSIIIYDPVTKTQQISPIEMNEARWGHKVIVYKNKLFVFGGKDADGYRLNSVEMFSPETNKFVMMAPMKIGRSGFGCCRVGNLVYVIGGATSVADRTSSVEIYNMDSNTWTDGVDLPVATYNLYACAVNFSSPNQWRLLR